MYGLEGRRAVVTGAAYGIGLAIASRLVKEGCAVALWDIDAASLEAARADLARQGALVTTHLVDVSDLGQTSRALDATISDWGAAPDIFVNNAGIGQVASILDATPEDFERTMQVNVRGTFNCCHLVAPLMCDRGNGNIVNVASWFGKSGRPMSLAYCASKFAIIGMTQSMGLDLAKTGVRVNAVCPGTIADTRMREQADEAALSKGLLPAADREHLIPLGRLGKPEDVARVVAFLVSEEAGYMTGQSINVTGGLWMN
ncbi:SDR family NAD(P)-dependent oxidoreductase [Mesorhizobium sp. CAU 1732]|uniref:SDR family NAD(P)-dependent oxidoreductase n=1 Tax=Mesorhizobium sp. CAU 1732 TaxID=3140358 RepID=UPI00326143EA